MAAEGWIEDSLDEGTLARTGYAGDDGEDVERNPYIDAAEIVHSGSLDLDGPVPCTMTGRNGNLLLVSEILDGMALRVFLQPVFLHPDRYR